MLEYFFTADLGQLLIFRVAFWITAQQDRLVETRGSEVFRKISIAAGITLASVMPSFAGFQAWSVEKESDPFSGGESVSVNFMSSLRSGVVLLCDSAQKGLIVRAIPGFDYVEKLKDFAPTVKFASTASCY